jgi:hypothetical protein
MNYFPEEFELYYPLGPTKALVLKKETHTEPTVNVDSYNGFMARVAREYVFAKTEDDLQKYFR